MSSDEIYVKLAQMQAILERVKEYFLNTLDSSLEESISAAIQEYDQKWVKYEMPQPLYDSSGEPILDSANGEIQAKLIVVTV